MLVEDYSGTGALARAWLKIGRDKRAVIVDQDAGALARAGRSARLKKVNADVLKVRDRADVIAATNFPICYWHGGRRGKPAAGCTDGRAITTSTRWYSRPTGAKVGTSRGDR